jgi:hypothetical protein
MSRTSVYLAFSTSSPSNPLPSATYAFPEYRPHFGEHTFARWNPTPHAPLLALSGFGCFIQGVGVHFFVVASHVGAG